MAVPVFRSLGGHAAVPVGGQAGAETWEGRALRFWRGRSGVIDLPQHLLTAGIRWALYVPG